MGVTLDDIRQPDFNGRVWGYDREEVDQLLAAVVTSVERLQRRRMRDAAAIERATAEATTASAQAEQAQRERDDLAIRLDLALRQAPGNGEAGDEGPAPVGGDDRAERLAAEAEERADRAERQLLVLREEMAQQRARTRRTEASEAEVRRLREELARLSERAHRAEVRVAAVVPPPPRPATVGGPAVVAAGGRGVVATGADLDDLRSATEAAVLLPLAQRAARALLREARASAAAIVAEAEQQAITARRDGRIVDA